MLTESVTIYGQDRCGDDEKRINPIQIASLSLYRFATPGTRIWAFGMMAAARVSLARMPGLEFWKLCGSGGDDTFTLHFDPSVYGIFCVWPDEATARTQLDANRLFARYREQSVESARLLLSPVSARGAWSRRNPFRTDPAPVSGPVAALTRATLRPRIARQFWSRVPDINARIGQNTDVLFRIGLGEVPALHQITFSVWPDTESMARFARKSGPHAEAIRAVRDNKWFSEELYARFRVLDASGRWQARPLLQETQLQ